MSAPMSPGMRELRGWIDRAGTPEMAGGADGYAERLYERIAREATDVEHLRLRAEATNARNLSEVRDAARALEALVRVLHGFTRSRAAGADDTAKRVCTNASAG